MLPWTYWKGSQGLASWSYFLLKSRRQLVRGARALWTGQGLRLEELVAKPGYASRIPSPGFTVAARCVRCNVHDLTSTVGNEENQRKSQDLLWRSFFQDHTRWWDIRHQKKNVGLPDFRHKESGEALWLNNDHKPAWVNAHLVTLDVRSDRSACTSTSSLSLDHADPLIDPASGNRLTHEAVIKLCQQGEVKGAVEALEILVWTNSSVDKYLFYFVLRKCVAKKDLMLGCKIHALAMRTGFGSDTFLCNHLVRMYAGHGKLREAMDVFRGVALPDAFMWSSIISAHIKQGQAERAVKLYQHMRATMTKPDSYVLVAALQACAAAGDLQAGKQAHDDVLTCGMEQDMFVCNCLVDMYAKCGSLKEARRVFDGLRKKDVVTWTVMIAGYAQEGMGREALDIYSSMHSEGKVIPDAVTFACLLEACTSVGALQQGKQLHREIREGGLETHILIGSSLVKMYAKCGRLEVSREVFGSLPVKDLVTWNALLKGYAENGEGRMAVQCFEELLEQGIQPDKVTYTCVITACSHAGLVDQGQHYFKSMVEQHGIEPDDQHYICMVDLLGRSGHLHKAERMLRASGVAGNAVSWIALLSACKSYCDAQIGRRCFDHLVRIEPTDATGYLLLGSIYANAGKWDEVERVESLRMAAGARKVPAKACIEIKKEVHEFTVGEERSDVAATLRKMNMRVKEGGHVPQTQLVLKAVSEQEKEDALCGHAEKLALAYGLLNTPDGLTLVVTKNLRMCNDCHSSTKIMSRLEKREIVVRDGHKVHRFQSGACSCQDRP